MKKISVFNGSGIVVTCDIALTKNATIFSKSQFAARIGSFAHRVKLICAFDVETSGTREACVTVKRTAQPSFIARIKLTRAKWTVLIVIGQ